MDSRAFSAGLSLMITKTAEQHKKTSCAGFENCFGNKNGEFIYLRTLFSGS
jgi:hypothetical protein